MRHTHISINQTALTHNLAVIKRHAPHASVMAMVKADAYGHGMAHCLPALMDADAFGVASFDEALRVHEICGHLSKRIILMGGVLDKDEWFDAQTHGFECVIHCQTQLDWALSHLAPMGSPTGTIWLKYNTGMNRLGFGDDDVLTAAKLLDNKGYRLILISHFACADDKDHPTNALQIKRFNDVLTILKDKYGNDIQGSLCNSAGIINFPHAHHDWVRTGIALYGASPVMGSDIHELNLLPAMNFSTQIFAIHELNAGETVSYGGVWMADKPTRIGVLSVGYGDGYPRTQNDAKVLITKDDGTYLAPIVGCIAMDMMMIDITNLPVGVGDMVMLWGDGLPADNVARWANTISYELFCKTTNRPHRRIIV